LENPEVAVVWGSIEYEGGDIFAILDPDAPPKKINFSVEIEQGYATA